MIGVGTSCLLIAAHIVNEKHRSKVKGVKWNIMAVLSDIQCQEVNLP